MGAERWIVFLVLASLGGGIYIMSYLVDEESIGRYGERVAEYNAQHHQTMMDAALHRVKRGPGVSPGNRRNVESKGVADHPYSENDRIMRASVIVGEDVDFERAKRSYDQSGKEEKPDNPGQETVSTSGQDINEEDRDNPPGESAWAKRSSGQGINEEDTFHLHRAAARAMGSVGQGTARETPSHPSYEATSGRKSAGQGVNMEDLSNPSHKIARVGESSMHSTKTLDEGRLNPSLVTDLFDSSEVDDGQEVQIPLNSNESPQTNDKTFNEFENSDLLRVLEQSSEESHEDSMDFQPEGKHIFPNAPSYEPDDLTPLSRRLFSSDDGDKKLITFNKGIDFILGLMNTMFSLEGEVSVPLPGLNKTFGHGIMKGTFEAAKGFFKNPASLHRTGDVDIVKNGDSVGLEVALGLETLEAGYDHYDLKILKIHQNGTLDVSIAENSIKMKISLTYYPHCKVDVNYLELDKLGGIKIDITGLGAFQSMFDMLSKWLLDNFTTDLKNIVNKKLIEKAKKAVAREDICKYFPLNLL